MLKIRCSAIGKIMTNPKKKDELISQGAKTYIQELLKENLYGFKKDVSSKYLDKGNFCEDEAIEYLSDNSDFGMLMKNEEFFSNDYLTGTPDLILKDRIIDIKNSWDCYTFPLFDDVIKNKDYYYQLQGYMALTGRKNATLAYMLVNTPEYIEEDSFDYSNLDSKLRIKLFSFERDEEVIKNIYNKVCKCQEYYNQLLSTLNI